MLFSERWLRTFVDPDLDAEALAHLLTMSGLEVEETRPAAPPTSGVVVAKVLAVEPHPDSDRLRVCRVDAGGDPLTIVCGSPDVAAGITVPCATVGAMLPGKSIGLATVRGVQSQGMLCSAEELGLAESSEGLLALDDGN